RDFHVTGVQTCALPICARLRLRALQGVRLLGPRRRLALLGLHALERLGLQHVTLPPDAGDLVLHGLELVLVRDRQELLLEALLRSEERRGGKEGWTRSW